MARTTLTDVGFRPRRVTLIMSLEEWALLEREAERTSRALGRTCAVILGLSIANRDKANSLTQQARDDSDARSRELAPVR